MAIPKGIRKTNNGKFQVTLDHGVVNGKRYKPTKTYDTIEEAEKALTIFKFNKRRIVNPSATVRFEKIRESTSSLNICGAG